MDFELALFDRLNVIRDYYCRYDLEHKSYIAFSGGKDSMVLSALIDLAVPDNNITRLYNDTGLDYKLMREHVYSLAEIDNRINILRSNVKIIDMLNTYGYPFKSKYHSGMVYDFNNKIYNRDLPNYIDRVCLKKFRYQFEEIGKYNFSSKCCYYLKKLPSKNWAQNNNKTVVITGIRKSEGGVRSFQSHCVKFYKNELIQFNPLFVLDDSFIDEFIERYNIKLCDLYYAPYNFKRTGCKGCPYNPDLKNTLNILKEFLPNEYKQCFVLWGDIYAEYKLIGYLLHE